MNLGDELIAVQADREFSSDTGFWTKNGTATIGDNIALCGTGTSGISRAALLELGSVYACSVTVGNYTASEGTEVGLATETITDGYFFPFAGTFHFEFIHNGTTSGYFGLTSNVSGVTFDNVSVKKVLSTRFSTDFADETVGQEPSTCTRRWHTLSAFTVEELEGTISGKVLQLGDPTGNNLQFLSWDVPGQFANADFLYHHRANTAPTDAFRHGAVVRGAGDETSETGYIINWTTSAQRCSLMRYLNASGTTLTNVYPFLFTDADWIWSRLNIFNQTIRVKSWLGAFEDQPAEWDDERVNTSVITRGYVGAFHYYSGTDQYDYFSVAIGGLTALGPAEAFTTTLNNSSALLASLSIARAVVASLANTTSIVAQLSLARALISAIANSSTLSGILTVTGLPSSDFIATLTNTSTLLADVSVARAFQASVSNQEQLQGLLSLLISLQATLANTSDFTITPDSVAFHEIVRLVSRISFTVNLINRVRFN
jgi:hypothetical protein